MSIQIGPDSPLGNQLAALSPAGGSCCTEREEIHQYVKALYPYLQAELFIRWSVDELGAVIDQWLDAFVEQGLLQREGSTLIQPPPSSQQFVMLTLLSRAVFKRCNASMPPKEDA